MRLLWKERKKVEIDGPTPMTSKIVWMECDSFWCHFQRITGFSFGFRPYGSSIYFPSASSIFLRSNRVMVVGVRNARAKTLGMTV